MRKLQIIVTLALVCMMAKADDRVLQVWQADGQVLNISLSEEPKTTYSDGNLVITTTKTTISYPLEQVKKYTYTTVETGISGPEAMKAMFSADGESLMFTDIKPNTTVFLFNVAGQLLRSFNAGKCSNFSVSVSTLPAGVYVVKANGITSKITKR